MLENGFLKRVPIYFLCKTSVSTLIGDNELLFFICVDSLADYAFAYIARVYHLSLTRQWCVFTMIIKNH